MYNIKLTYFLFYLYLLQQSKKKYIANIVMDKEGLFGVKKAENHCFTTYKFLLK